MAEEIVLVIAKDQNNQEEDYFKQVYIRQLIEKKILPLVIFSCYKMRSVSY